MRVPRISFSHVAWGEQLAPLFKAIAQELKELRQLTQHQQQRIDDLCNERTKTWAQIAAPKKIAKVPGSGKTEIIIVPDYRETEIKERASTATPTAVKAQVGKIVEAARRLPDGSTVLRVAPAQEGKFWKRGNGTSGVWQEGQVVQRRCLSAFEAVGT